jgi:hypothetical protein
MDKVQSALAFSKKHGLAKQAGAYASAHGHQNIAQLAKLAEMAGGAMRRHRILPAGKHSVRVRRHYRKVRKHRK